ncbi:unnamed protein product [Paramecium pentaurelia]|uniref:Uncharacterized protein n=1 Tax=Paramecium pentaurelia TaxID=43138 RepID=A0A8S1VTC4_9CILI|nr:unnamed protein product [Paramecium pentaurelia]
MDKEKKVEDDFTNLKDQIHILLYQLRSTVQQKAKYANVQRNVDSIKIDIEITQKSLSKQYKDKKKYSEKTIRTNKTIYFIYRQQVYDLQQQLDLNAIIYQQQQTNNSVEQVRILKNNLMDQDDRKTSVITIHDLRGCNIKRYLIIEGQYLIDWTKN